MSGDFTTWTCARCRKQMLAPFGHLQIGRTGGNTVPFSHYSANLCFPCTDAIEAAVAFCMHEGKP